MSKYRGKEVKEMFIEKDGIKLYYCNSCARHIEEDKMYLTPSGLKRRDLRCKECSKKRAKDYRDNNMTKVLYANALKRAKIRNIPFDIELGDVIIPEFCPILEIPILIGASMKQRNLSPSLDRINNSSGYIKGNVRVISTLANSMKRDVEKDLLFKFSKNIIDYMI